MAVAYLNEGAVSFAAANWSDATGFADNAELVVNKPFGPVTMGLDQSGLTTGIDYLDFKPGAVGVVGGPAGSLQVDADSAGADYIRNRGAVTLYLSGGGSSQINNLDLGGQQRTFLSNATVTTLTIDGGTLDVAESAIITTGHFLGGSGTVEFNATGGTNLYFIGGTWTLKRMPTNLYVGGNARVTLDFDDSESFTSTQIQNWGGTVNWNSGAIPTVVGRGGVFDYRNADSVFAPGATSFVASGTTIYEGDGTVDTSNITYEGAMNRSVGGFVPAP